MPPDTTLTVTSACGTLDGMEIYTPETWIAVRDKLPSITFLLEYMLPAKAKTCLHGPPGCGKSAFAWGVANAITEGVPYMGLATVRAKVLLVSNDMNQYEFKFRWGNSFLPKFAFCCTPKIDITKPTFRVSEVYKLVKRYVAEHDIDLVIFDALGGLHAGRSAKDDEVATLVDSALSEWLPDAAVLLLAHDRKIRTDREGNPLEPSAEDLMGSQMWRSNTTSQIHMHRANDHVSVIQHTKSQVGPLYTEQVKVYIDLNGIAEPWDEHRASDVVQRFNRGVALLKLERASATEQIEQIAKYYGVQPRTVWRWKSLAKCV